MTKNRISNDTPDETTRQEISKEDKITDSTIKTLKKSAVKPIATVVYCGPTIKGVVKQYSHFCNGIPKKLKDYIDQNKEVKRLIVPLENLIETRKNISITGTIENISYMRIQKGE